MKALNHHQRYLLEEFAQDYLERSISRRDLLRRSLLATGSIALTGTTLFALGCSSNDDDDGETPATPSSEPTSTTTEATTTTQSHRNDNLHRIGTADRLRAL